VPNLVLRQIHDVFEMAGIKRGQLMSGRPISGARRALVEEYYASINWHSEADADKFLKVLGYTFAQTYLTEDARNLLRKCCEREGLIVDGINVYRKSGRSHGKHVSPVSPAALADLKKLLLDMSSLESHRRGFAFEKFLTEIFNAYSLAPRGSFRLVGEQIDGSFEINSDTYLLEAKWHMEQTSQNDLLVFREKVENKSTWSRGLFVSYSGFTEDGIKAFARGRATNIIGMTGQDLFFILDEKMSLVEAILRKARRAAETGEFFVSVFDLV
jgi:hypothetical protein